MNKKTSLNKLLYIQEHLSCRNYREKGDSMESYRIHA